jgi:hypothetical protein
MSPLAEGREGRGPILFANITNLANDLTRCQKRNTSNGRYTTQMNKFPQLVIVKASVVVEQQLFLDALLCGITTDKSRYAWQTYTTRPENSTRANRPMMVPPSHGRKSGTLESTYCKMQRKYGYCGMK